MRATANAHPALHHPWLEAMATGAVTDLAGAFRDFAIEYQGYQSRFPLYLRLVIDSLRRPEHQQLLRHNLAEEKGHLDATDAAALAAIGIDPATVAGVPHPALFRRFATAIGVRDRDLEPASPAAIHWRQKFIAFLRDASPAAAVGALGLGTEQIVRPVYLKLLRGIRQLGLARADYVFFELHCEVDDQHQKDLLAIALELIDSPPARADLRRGMLAALDLRNAFWSHLHARLRPCAQVPVAGVHYA